MTVEQYLRFLLASLDAIKLINDKLVYATVDANARAQLHRMIVRFECQMTERVVVDPE